MSEQEKVVISPEQRLTKRIQDHVYYTKGAYSETIPMECTPQDVRQILKLLADYEDIGLSPEEIKNRLSSEQAWSERFDKAHIRFTEVYVQLNQAIEVLKGILEEHKKYDKNNVLLSHIRLGKSLNVARDFLSSLPQGTEEAHETNK